MTTSPANLTLADLIRLVKGEASRGGLTYDDLAARRELDDDGRPIGPGADRLEQIVNYPLKAFPDARSIRGLANILRVSEQTIIDASARSLGLNVQREKSLLELRLPPGHERLPPEIINGFLTMLEHQVQALPPAEPEPEPGPRGDGRSRRASKTTPAGKPTRRPGKNT